MCSGTQPGPLLNLHDEQQGTRLRVDSRSLWWHVNLRRLSSVFTMAWYADYATMGAMLMRRRFRTCLSLLTASAISVGALVATGAAPASAAPATPQFVQVGAKEV